MPTTFNTWWDIEEARQEDSSSEWSQYDEFMLYSLEDFEEEPQD